MLYSSAVTSFISDVSMTTHCHGSGLNSHCDSGHTDTSHTVGMSSCPVISLTCCHWYLDTSARAFLCRRCLLASLKAVYR